MNGTLGRRSTPYQVRSRRATAPPFTIRGRCLLTTFTSSSPCAYRSPPPGHASTLLSPGVRPTSSGAVDRPSANMWPPTIACKHPVRVAWGPGGKLLSLSATVRPGPHSLGTARRRRTCGRDSRVRHTDCGPEGTATTHFPRDITQLDVSSAPIGALPYPPAGEAANTAGVLAPTRGAGGLMGSPIAARSRCCSAAVSNHRLVRVSIPPARTIRCLLPDAA
jgi:hypothetical protein